MDLITGEPGSTVLFDCNLMHGSSGLHGGRRNRSDNITPHGRTNLFIVYNSTENVLEPSVPTVRSCPSARDENLVRASARPAR